MLYTKGSHDTRFLGASQNCEEHLLASSCLSVCVKNLVSTGRILMKFEMYFPNNRRESLSFIKIGEEWILCMKATTNF